MKYISWLWRNSCGIRWNAVVRIMAGIVQVVLGLLMVWLSKWFIDEPTEYELYSRLFKIFELYNSLDEKSEDHFSNQG